MDHEDYTLNLTGIAIWQWGMLWALWTLHIDWYTNVDNIMESVLLFYQRKKLFPIKAWSCNNEAGILYVWVQQDGKDSVPNSKKKKKNWSIFSPKSNVGSYLGWR